jgi:hypothetical protein
MTEQLWQAAHWLVGKTHGDEPSPELVKKVLEYVSDASHHTLAEPLTGAPLVALYAGVALHLLGHVGFRRRNIGTWNPHRTLVAIALLILLPVAWQLPALAALAIVAGLLSLLVAYELWRFRSARDQVRHHPGPAG